jgi:hypothetical protein
MMELTLALLADYANMTREGKLNLMGIFNRVFAPSFPAHHLEMRLVMKFSAPPGETGTKKNVVVKLLNADGKLVLQTAGDVTIPEESSSVTFELVHILDLRLTPFEKPGQYAFHILVNGDTKGMVPFDVVQTPQASTEVD